MLRKRNGQGLVEYALILVLLTVVAIVALLLLTPLAEQAESNEGDVKVEVLYEASGFATKQTLTRITDTGSRAVCYVFVYSTYGASISCLGY